MGKLAFAAWRLQYRSTRFLHLQKQRLVVIRQEQREVTTCSHTADTHHLYRHVLEAIAVEQLEPISRQRFSILLDVVLILFLEILSSHLHMVDERRVVLDLRTSVHQSS